MKKLILLAIVSASMVANHAGAQAFSFSTGDPDGRLATGSRPSSAGKIEIESADDFLLTVPTQITGGSFTGLIPAGLSLSSVGQVNVEIYRVFPNDSDVGRTSGAPTFATAKVPTRVNSPSDVAFTSRDSSPGGGLTFTSSVVNATFTAANSILNGIHPTPTQFTGGEGPVSGQEVQFLLDFTTPLNLGADHYFFVPQVQLSNGDFFWLSAAGPPLFTGDLQAWIRNEDLAPDWLREGTDIVGGGLKFNESFSLSGQAIPDSGSTFLLFSAATVILLLCAKRSRFA